MEWNGGMEWWNGLLEWNSGMAMPTKCCSVSMLSVNYWSLSALEIMEDDHAALPALPALPAVSRSVTQVALQPGARNKATLKHIFRSGSAWEELSRAGASRLQRF